MNNVSSWEDIFFQTELAGMFFFVVPHPHEFELFPLQEKRSNIGREDIRNRPGKSHPKIQWRQHLKKLFI